METIEALKKLDGFHGAKVYFVGGYVRDLLRRKKNDDLDVVVKDIDIPQIRKFLNRYGKTKVVNQTFGVLVILFKAFRCKTEAQITFPRNKDGEFKPSNDLKEDASCRDFTINAMYLPIKSKSRTKIIDFFGGYAHIRGRILSAVGNPYDRIVESPIRILRALSLASRTKYRIRNNLINSMRDNAGLLNKVPAELVRKELNNILLHDRPSKYFKMMHRLGILKVILPELDRCYGVRQDKRYHKYDVFKHCLYTCDHIDPVLTLRLAALFHDIGKPVTKREIGDKVTFHKHEVVGTKITKAILQRLKYDKETIKEVIHLIRLHMYHYTREFSDAAVRRFIKKAHIIEDDLDDLGNIPLFKLRAAERLGNGYKTIPVTDRQLDFEERIKTVFKESNGFDIKDLDINGDVIMELFNITQSPRIGDILKYLLTKILKNPKVNNRIDLIKLAAEHIYRNSK